MVGLPKIKDFANDLLRRRPWRALRRAGSVAEARVAVRVVSLLPLVEALPGDSEVAARAGDASPVVPRDGQEFGTPGDKSGLF